ncbi:replication initiation factor domain-containing protein [Vibrio nitrifigilis]|uniref:Replication initiation factor domain-containing protein n=1 Tax=Vibrio nitrifigilis TaxID=2789781 RepID=A0ABS0GJN2_9VIBR|nr:replication initiation factor domain-containing protein [Vibrio nitrifigilis]MBF9000489.1 replication initiation factor domain-containing protein [Vibrio nitrifigilis]MBF9001582.1 replication initiation factor domain-containing protein [Vibrio nitrifigilis]MBF9002646.1 replication initiation factor domain-containing protein [Vibrio nitrifigilis]
MSRTIIDYVSFSGTPLILERCKEMAKQRYAFADGSAKSAHPMATMREENKKIAYFGENLAQVLGCVDENDYANKDLYFSALNNALCDADLYIESDTSFHDSYQQLISNIGIDMLDVLCHGELESFLELLQEEISYDGNVWTVERRGGYSGYRYSAKLLCNGIQAGIVAWGAANFGFYVSFSGKGCTAISMERLHKALSQMAGTKLTRVDLALDDLEGNITIDEIKERYQDGMFITQGKPPCWGEFLGGTGASATDKRKCGFVPDKGHTFYVGDRNNGKLFRGYHKGAQLNSTEYPNWNRFEVQIGNRYRVIPLDIIVNPDPYFAGAYPALASLISEVQPVRISTVKLTFKTNLENAIKHARVQYGKLVNAMRLLYEDDSHVMEVLTRGFELNDIPDRINFPVGWEYHHQKTGELAHG